MRLHREILQLRRDFRREAAGANLLRRLQEILCGVVEAPFRRDDLDRRQREYLAVRLLQYAPGRLGACYERLDEVFLGLGRIADGDEVLLGDNIDQAIARSVLDRFCDQLAVFGEGFVELVELDGGWRWHAAKRRKALRRGLVESKVRGRRARADEG